jgi:hypothetical protein
VDLSQAEPCVGPRLQPFLGLAFFTKPTHHRVLYYSFNKLCACFTLFFFFSTGVWTQGLHLEPVHEECLTLCVCVCVMGFFKIGFHELFAWAGFELCSSWSLGWAGGVAQVTEECLPSKYEALSSNTSTAKEKKKKMRLRQRFVSSRPVYVWKRGKKDGGMGIWWRGDLVQHFCTHVWNDYNEIPSCFFFIFFLSTGVWIQGPMLSR